MNRFLLFLLVATGWMACQPADSGDADAAGNKPATDSATRLYPFPQYLQGQISYVDSMPLPIWRIEKMEGRLIDSSLVSKEAFKAAVLPFTQPDPNSLALKGKYQETSFQDLSLEAITFSITSTDPDLELQQADILIHPETQRVKHVMQKRIRQEADSTVVQQLLWIHNLRCQISEIIQKADGKQYVRSISYVWDEDR
ncbi:MAG: hypothetical protein MUF29_06000 [Chitinophagaceae bacterium]|jgi:hypothetical protein|nr:hypothetical protein [Chitinophagaceae bacterium]